MIVCLFFLNPVLPVTFANMLLQVPFKNSIFCQPLSSSSPVPLFPQPYCSSSISLTCFFLLHFLQSSSSSSIFPMLLFQLLSLTLFYQFHFHNLSPSSSIYPPLIFRFYFQFSFPQFSCSSLISPILFSNSISLTLFLQFYFLNTHLPLHLPSLFFQFSFGIYIDMDIHVDSGSMHVVEHYDDLFS
jgi:hypothetical protein